MRINGENTALETMNITQTTPDPSVIMMMTMYNSIIMH